MIPNHQSAKLSELDLWIARSVPPGGNWRNIPKSVPSARIEQIRESAAAGEGSRSTYYGRLHPDRPAYTINTYYNRPGNGCFLHPDIKQNRTLSHREAARLQSFPDNFVFTGPQRAICQQIGNAVPPLLALQIAKAIGPAGKMVDVFAGAGGLSLGFKWAGWESLMATDIDRHSVETFNRNVAPVAFVGDMQDDAVIEKLAECKDSSHRLALVGGPPCQGFSTGGKRRRVDDIRNVLHERYAILLSKLKPEIFIFENVLGLLSMSKGEFLQRIVAGLSKVGYDVDVWKMNAAEYGIPQKRQRVIIVGVPHGRSIPKRPSAWTTVTDVNLLSAVEATSVSDSLCDLPPISAGQDGSALNYVNEPTSLYQAMMRGRVSPDSFLDVRSNIGTGVAA